MNKVQVKGAINETEGKVKQVTGSLVGNKDLEEKGKVQKNVGKVQGQFGDLKDKLKKGN